MPAATTMPVMEPPKVRDGEWEFDMPFTTQLSLNDRKHWAVKMKDVKEWRDAAAVLARHHKIPPCRRILLELHFHPKVNRRRDDENLVATMKPIADGLVDAGVVQDDTEAFVTRQYPVIHQATGKPNRFCVRIVAL